MYIRHDASINEPAHSVRRELLEPPERWLPASVASNVGDGRYLVRVGFHAAAAHIAKQVELTLGTPEQPGQWLVIPVGWRATGPGQLFPVLDGRLTLQPLGPHSSTIWLGATYQPPLGALGRELDAAVMHNVATATIRDFVEGVAARLAELAAARPA
ncbi:MAG TPA: hypothetical protein VOB72_21590 [Candidatus Dormibacteraeota bacterium]|nr:hypothetical protein [Candidatus Dormibacteraeota bacterium]